MNTPNTRRRDTLNKLRNRKTKKNLASNQEITDMITELSIRRGIPADVQNIISKSTRRTINKKIKRDIELLPRLKRIQSKNNYQENGVKELSTKLFYSLPQKYKKGYILALENEIHIPNRNTLLFLIERGDELVKYIGNRHENVHPDVYVFIRDYYGDFGIEPPTKVKFRELVNHVDNFFSEIQ
tara:strand:- start:275 stop:826 length:552 start_codon:yes stop_codon:yes gene_type:complete